MTKTRPIRRLLLPLGLGLLVLVGCVPPWPGIGQTSVSVIPRTGGQYGGPSSNVTSGPDFALYLVQSNGLVRRDPNDQSGSGSTVRIPLTGPCQQVGRLVLGPDGALWGTAVNCPSGDILRITIAGGVRTFALTAHRTAAPSALAQPMKFDSAARDSFSILRDCSTIVASNAGAPYAGIMCSGEG